jgi:head-tail adaptor
LSLLGLCNTTIIVQRPTITMNAHGGQSRSWAAVYTDIAATKQPASGRIRDVAAKEGIEVDHTFYTPIAVACRPGDRVLHGSDYHIVAWSEDQAGRGEVYAIHCKQLID